MAIILNKVFKSPIKEPKVSMVESPNNTDSWAEAPPNKTWAPPITTGPIVSKLIDSLAFKLIEFWELNNKWSL